MRVGSNLRCLLELNCEWSLCHFIAHRDFPAHPVASAKLPKLGSPMRLKASAPTFGAIAANQSIPVSILACRDSAGAAENKNPSQRSQSGRG
jgi:hypothetical protein